MLNPTKSASAQAPQGMPESEGTRSRAFRPNVDIVETGESIELFADMPGVDEKSTEVTLERNVLTIKGRVDWKTPDTHRSLLREFEIGDYERVFTLATQVDESKIQATVKHGVLHLVLPKAGPAKARRIAVTSR